MNETRVPRYRRLLSFGTIAIAVAATGVWMATDLYRVNGKTHQIFSESVAGLDLVGELQFEIQEARRFMMYALTTPATNLHVQYADQSRAADARANRLLRELQRPDDTPASRAARTRVAEAWASYLQSRDKVLSLILEGDNASALSLTLGEGQSRFARVRDEVAALKQSLREHAQHNLAITETSFHYALAKLAVLLVLTQAAAIAASVLAQKKALLEDVRRTEAQLALIVESSEDAIFSRGLDRVVRSWNAAAERMFGYRADEIVGQAVVDMVPADRQAEEFALFDRIKGGHRLSHYETVRLRRDGSPIDVALTLSPILGSNGAVEAVSIIVRDVTAQKQATERVRESEEQLLQAQEIAHVGSWQWNLRTGIWAWSEEQYRLFGLEPGSVTPSLNEYLRFVHTADRSAARDVLRGAAETGSRFDHEHRIVRADGTVRTVQARARIALDRTSALKMLGVMQDITDRKEADRMKSNFVSFVSHQLRTPLAGMNWMLELAAETPDLPAQASGYIADARTSADRLVALVNDLLDISRLESGRLAGTPEPLQLEEMTRSVLAEFQTLTAEKRQAVGMTVSGVPSVVADPQLVRQAIANLVSNAIKYTPVDGSIAIRIEQQNGVVSWAIRDTGIGIPPAAQSRLFEKFYRAENALAIESEGTGLGLHLVRLVVEHFRGRVWCESEQGQGTTFTFTLPVGDQLS